MTLHPDIAALVTAYGLVVLTPLAIVEGPIVTIIAASLAGQGLLNLKAVFVCVVLADLVGDSLLYALGRGLLGKLSPPWRNRLGLSSERMTTLVDAFHTSGAKLLVAGKWTHAAGFAVLVAAGVARMQYLRFLLVNLLATIPKSLFLIAIGYFFGTALAQPQGWISGGALALAGIALMAALVWIFHRKRSVA